MHRVEAAKKLKRAEEKFQQSRKRAGKYVTGGIAFAHHFIYAHVAVSTVKLRHETGFWFNDVSKAFSRSSLEV